MSFPTTNPALARALAARGYTVPTAVQIAVLEADATNRDLLVSAQTGSGKTVAFGLAFGETLLGDAERLPPAGAPMALIVAPTRELAMQVSRELTWLYEATGARVVTCVGGMDARAESRQLQAGAHIVVGTPGRLRDHIERRRLDLGELRVAVLDEADEMLDLGFREDLEFILDATPVERRTLLFSATLPREIETLAGRYQRDAVRIQTVRRNEPHADIDYVAHRVSPQDIEHAVVNVLRFNEARAALVFCSTREAVNRYSARLIERGFQAVALSGEFTQHERTRALQSLRDGRARVLVATDVAARGLDLPDLALVIHAELPHDAETLLHRSGRTGRAGRKGQCVLIVPYNRRRKADALIAGARLKVTWSPAPTPDDIRTRDHERFVADASFTNAASDEELNRARALQSARTADEIALALVRLHEVRLPAPEDLMIDTGPPAREWRPRDNYPDAPRFRRDGHAPRGGRDNREPAYRPDAAGPRHPAPRSGMRPGHHRDAGRAMVWFRINIGRERNADPRWLLPLICRAGGVTKSEIGAIRIEDTDSRFEIAAEFADQFDHTFRTNKKKEGHIVRLDAGGASEAPEGAVTAALSGTTNGVGSVVPDTVTPVGATGPDARETSRERPKRAPDETGKKRIKARWRDQGKPDRAKSKGKAKSAADGWAPRRRDDKVAAKAPRPSGRSQGHGDTGTRPATKLHKKKQRSGATAKS